MAEIGNSLRLAELVCTRLCHDLSSLLGALDGTLSLIAEDLPPGHETLSYAQDASAELIGRLRLLRAAWGEDPGPLTLPAVRELAAGLPRAHQIHLDVSALPADSELPSPSGRMLLNLLLLGAEGLPAGGRIMLAGVADDLFIRIEGLRAAWPAGLAACLADEKGALAALTSARVVQVPLTALMAHSLGLRLSLLMAPVPDGQPAPLRLNRA